MNEEEFKSDGSNEYVHVDDGEHGYGRYDGKNAFNENDDGKDERNGYDESDGYEHDDDAHAGDGPNDDIHDVHDA